MTKKWNSIEEMRFLNKVYAIFEKYRIAPELIDPEFEGLYIIHKESVYDIINEVFNLAKHEYPLWNFGRFPDSHGPQG